MKKRSLSNFKTWPKPATTWNAAKKRPLFNVRASRIAKASSSAGSGIGNAASRLSLELDRAEALRTVREEDLAKLQHDRELRLDARVEVESRRIEHRLDATAPCRDQRSKRTNPPGSGTRPTRAWNWIPSRSNSKNNKTICGPSGWRGSIVRPICIEADGLESRVVNLRAVLLHSKRSAGTLLADGNDGRAKEPATPATPNDADSNDSAISQREAELLRISEELAAQRFALTEYVDRLVRRGKRGVWKNRESLRSCAGWRNTSRAKSAVAENESRRFRPGMPGTRSGRASSLRQSGSKRGRQGRKPSRRPGVRNWGGAMSIYGSDNLERRENALAELCRRWSVRRRQEIDHLRTEHSRCRQLRLECVAHQAFLNQHEQEIETQRHSVQTQAMIVETARRKLLRTVENPLLAEKRIERLSRRFRSSLAKAEAQLEEQRQAVLKEREQLEEVYRLALEQTKNRPVPNAGRRTSWRNWNISSSVLRGGKSFWTRRKPFGKCRPRCSNASGSISRRSTVWRASVGSDSRFDTACASGVMGIAFVVIAFMRLDIGLAKCGDQRAMSLISTLVEVGIDDFRYIAAGQP